MAVHTRDDSEASGNLLIGAPLSQQFCVIMTWIFLFVCMLTLGVVW